MGKISWFLFCRRGWGRRWDFQKVFPPPQGRQWHPPSFACLHLLHCSLVHAYSCLHLLAIRPFEDMAGDFLRRVYEGRGGDAVFTKSFIFCIQRLHHLEPHSPWRQELALKGRHWGVATHPLIWSTTSFLPKRALSGGFCLTNAAMNYWLPFFSKVVNGSTGASSLSQMK